ncbi:MAG: murein L,D-transpeptidase catalytic domain family protein [Chlorobiales bacterium]|nr:murein L,D-transpeptidase catalytic domain family protein [Chlorobiales bacterium]
MIRLIPMLFMMLLMLFPSEGGAMSADNNLFRNNLSALSQSSELKNKINPMVLSKALSGYYSLKEQGKVNRDGILTVIDFNRPSVDERLFVIDVNRGVLLYSGLVAHGKGSGDNYAQYFSNSPGSHQSSLGFYTTGNTYGGKHGCSLKLLGMERGINDNAESRSIVIHGANYVSYDFIRKHGRLGRSQGCPALSFDSFQKVIDLIKGGSCLFIYHAGRDYAIKSTLLKPDLAKLQSFPSNRFFNAHQNV